MPRFSELIGGANVEVDAFGGEAEVTGLVADSRKVVGGSLFVCMPGKTSDTNPFISEAVRAGAAAVVAHDIAGFKMARDAGVAACCIDDRGARFYEGIGGLCDVFFEHPTRGMKVVGVTGTNGKTTTCWILRDAFEALGLRPGYLGTLGFRTPKGMTELANTTPFPVDLFERIVEARRDEVTHFAMEVSSHALEERRSEGVEFDVGVFTNLSQDHLDFHGSMAQYEAAKKRLFTDLPQKTEKSFRAVLNADDPVGAKWAAELSVPVMTFGQADADLTGRPMNVLVDRITMRLRYRGAEQELTSQLGGHYNVANNLAAAAALLALDFDLEAVVNALSHATPVPGRFEPVPNDSGIGILVDYAHTPDALEKLLDAVRDLPHNRVITVFGCGGDRDRAKRPLMARAASERSDMTVITSDNPRTEDPSSIIRDIEAGVTGASVSIVDRREAIAHAVAIARPGDIVVIAGKGHENYQIIGRTKHPMDDRELAREALAPC